MTNINKLLFFATFLFLTFQASAQMSVQRSVIGTAGSNTVSDGNLSASWTAGETVIGTHISGTITLTSGFQQATEEESVAVDNPESGISFKVYPNPTFGEIQVELQGITAADIYLELFNSQGQQINISNKRNINASRDEVKLNMTTQPAGTYFLLVTDSDKDLIGNVKIIKAN